MFDNREKQEAEEEKIKRAVPLEWRRNKTKSLRSVRNANRKFERGTEISEWKIHPPCGADGRQKCL
jgi:hypothetical protein